MFEPDRIRLPVPDTRKASAADVPFWMAPANVAAEAVVVVNVFVHYTLRDGLISHIKVARRGELRKEPAPP